MELVEKEAVQKKTDWSKKWCFVPKKDGGIHPVDEVTQHVKKRGGTLILVKHPETDVPCRISVKYNEPFITEDMALARVVHRRFKSLATLVKGDRTKLE